MCSYVYGFFKPNFSLSVLNPLVLLCGFLLYRKRDCFPPSPTTKKRGLFRFYGSKRNRTVNNESLPFTWHLKEFFPDGFKYNWISTVHLRKKGAMIQSTYEHFSHKRGYVCSLQKRPPHRSLPFRLVTDVDRRSANRPCSSHNVSARSITNTLGSLDTTWRRVRWLTRVWLA